MGSNGALLDSSENLNRFLEVQVRVGSYEMDNTHKVKAAISPASAAEKLVPVPLEDDPVVLRRAIWLETDKQYRSAAEALVRIQTNKEVQVQSAEEGAADFSKEKPQKFYGVDASSRLDRKPWEQKVRDYTASFASPATSIPSLLLPLKLKTNIKSTVRALSFSSVRCVSVELLTRRSFPMA